MNQSNHGTKKSFSVKMRRIASLLAVSTLLFSFAGCSKETPREALDKAFDKTFATNNPAEALLGTQALNEAISEGKGYSNGISLTLQEISGEGLEDYAGILSGLGISIDAASDMENKKSEGTLGISYGGTTYLSVGGQMDNSKLYLTVPQLLDGSLSIDFASLEEDLASDSMMAQVFALSGITLPEDFSAEIFDSFMNPATLELPLNLIEACEELDEEIVVEKATKEDVSLPSDISAKSVYTMTIPQDAYEKVLDACVDYVDGYSSSLMESMSEFSGEEIDTEDFDSSVADLKTAMEDLADTIGDVVITVAVNKDGYVTYMASEIETDTETVTFTASLTGKENPLEETEIEIEYELDGDSMTLTYEESFDSEEKVSEFSVDLDVNKETLFELSGELEFTDIEKGKSYALDINYLELNLANEFTCSLSGSCYLDTTECEISSPSGTEYELFAMSEDEFTALVLEVMTNLQTDPLFSELLNYIDFGY